MTESRVQIGISQEYLETFKTTNDAGTVHREGTFNASPTDEAAKQECDLIPQAARTISYDSAGVPIVDSTANASKSLLVDAAGVPITTYTTTSGTNALDIHDADVHTDIINQPFHQLTAVTTTLAVALVGDGTEYIIEVADATGFVLGDSLELNTTTLEALHPIITDITGTTFTLDRRIDGPHAIGSDVTVALLEMSQQIGTMANPQEYFNGPAAGEVWHLERIMFEMTHGTAGDLGKFGGIPEIANGVTIRSRIDGQYKSIAHWKRNGNMKTDMFDVDFDNRSGGGGAYGTSGRWTFERIGAIIRLDGDTNDQLEIYIQDDISGLVSFTMNMQGHLEDA